MNIKFICKNCGSVNEKDRDLIVDPNYSIDDWLCELPNNFEWILPVGKITPIVGSPLYVSSLGGNLTRSEYIKKYNVDPEIAYQLMRRDEGKSLVSGMDPEKIKSLITAARLPDSDE
jgi:hypothetical protein